MIELQIRHQDPLILPSGVKEQCWNDVRSIEIELLPIKDMVLTTEETKYEQKLERKQKNLDNGIEIQAFVIQTNFEYWNQLFGYYMNSDNLRSLTITQRDILRKYVEGKLPLPSENRQECYIRYIRKPFKRDGNL